MELTEALTTLEASLATIQNARTHAEAAVSAFREFEDATSAQIASLLRAVGARHINAKVSNKNTERERKIESALRLAWDSPVSPDEISAVKGASAVRRYKSAFAAAASVELVLKVGNGYLTNKTKLNSLVKLSERYNR